jgi:hypothetical protein
MSAIDLPRASAVVTNFGELLEALAVGWANPNTRRVLLGLDNGKGLIRTGYIGMPFFREPGDIDCDTGSYRPRGFIRFEAAREFRGMFEIGHADDGAWYSARLTQQGYVMASNGVIDLPTKSRDFMTSSFFNPAAVVVHGDQALAAPKIFREAAALAQRSQEPT